MDETLCHACESEGIEEPARRVTRDGVPLCDGCWFELLRMAEALGLMEEEDVAV